MQEKAIGGRWGYGRKVVDDKTLGRLNGKMGVGGVGGWEEGGSRSAEKHRKERVGGRGGDINVERSGG
jgi:hypothetical protein